MQSSNSTAFDGLAALVAVALVVLILGSTLVRADDTGDCAQRIHLKNAITACTQLIERAHREGRADLDEFYKSRADAYFAAGNYDGAVDDLSKAIALNPEDSQGYLRRGLAYEKVGDHKNAVADFSALIRLEPDSATAYTMRGGAYEMGGDKAKAIADFRSALAIDPSLQTVKSAIWRLGGAI